MQPPPSRGEHLNASCLSTKKRFSAIFRGFQGVLEFLYGFSCRTAGWAGPSPARRWAGRGRCGRSPLHERLLAQLGGRLGRLNIYIYINYNLQRPPRLDYGGSQAGPGGHAAHKPSLLLSRDWARPAGSSRGKPIEKLRNPFKTAESRGKSRKIAENRFLGKRWPAYILSSRLEGGCV